MNMASTISRRIPLEDWGDAFQRLEAKKDIKVMIYPNEKYRPK
jgi:threonine dehydrogenase-like Zn-dependent dehydrogenase